MIKKCLVTSCLFVCLVQTNVATAKGSIVGKVGTMGGGLEYVHPLSSKLAIGIGANGLSFDDTLQEGSVSYDADLQMESIAVIADYHPFENSFRISGGAMKNNNKFDLEGTPVGDEEIELADKTYKASDIGSLTGSIIFKNTAPYIGIGWGSAPEGEGGWSFDADLGLIFQDSPSGNLSVQCGVQLSDNECAFLKTNVAAEEESLENSLEDLKILPVISIGTSYKFL